jgi:hypothetical protein
MSWTQPVCNHCWTERRPDQPNPHRMKIPQLERCCYCGQETTSGIYTRDDPNTVPYPSADA